MTHRRREEVLDSAIPTGRFFAPRGFAEIAELRELHGVIRFDRVGDPRRLFVLLGETIHCEIARAGCFPIQLAELLRLRLRFE